MGSLEQADITGTTLLMQNGQLATVVSYKNSKDMTIQFEDGTIKEHVYKVHFVRGRVANPNIGDKQKGAGYTNINNNSIIGMSVKQNCGLVATCIEYRGSKDIDIQFEDGTIVQHKYKYNFINGNIANPNILIGNIQGEINTMNCGMMAQVIADRAYNDIDVQFEDGTIVEHRSRGDFKNGEIACASLSKYYSNRKHYVSDCNIMNCGMKAEILCYRNSDDIDIIFEDGTIVENKTVTNFKKGNIDNPNYYRYNIIGEELIMNCGMYCKVIEQDRTVTDLTVQFEDGTIIKHKTKREFYSRSIQNPNIPKFNSMPQAIVYFVIKKYFKDAICDYRPSWLINEKTKNKLEIDIWIPSLNIGIEYDGAVNRHTECTWRGMMKLEAINRANQIKKIIVINEKTTYIYNSDKIEHYILHNRSNKREYKDLITELFNVLEDILSKIGVKNIITPYDIDANFEEFNYSRFLNNLKALFKVQGIAI